MNTMIDLAETRRLPDFLIRFGIRRLVRSRLHDEQRQPAGTKAARLQALRDSPVALNTDEANAQHYELPAEFFAQVLGPRMKYSACLFRRPGMSLAEAEEDTLALYAQRLQAGPGHRVLDLGCGWGSFSLWFAARNPGAQVTAVSNSNGQRAFIEARAQDLGLTNLQVITADVNELDLPAASYDRVISVEMFEHVRNYDVLMRRISRWLKPDGLMLAHIFCHRELVYPFEVAGEDDWMARHFFTGGLMPSADTLLAFQDDLALKAQWAHDGTHYQRTARAWLENMDANATQVVNALTRAYGDAEAHRWQQRWRMFFMACEEMFAYDRGEQWQVCHYLFERRP